MSFSLTVSQQARVLAWAVDRGLLSQEDIGLWHHPDAVTLSEADLAERFQELLDSGRLKGAVEAVLEGDLTPTAEASAPPDWVRAMGEAAAALKPEDLEGFALPRNGRYLPLEFLGDGGMGCVYKAFDQQLKRVVALKFLKRQERAPVEQFLLEGRAQARIEHPNICNVYSVDEYEGRPYLSMRFIAGPTLKAVIPRLSVEQKVRIIAQVAQALHSCHRQGIVHRDLKPTNIMLEVAEDGGWWPYLMDFGLARDQAEADASVPGLILGTPLYGSPEQVLGQSVDRRSDVYSLGATLYECLCGQPPFPSHGSLSDLVRRIVEVDPPKPRQLVPALPLDLQMIVLKALEKNPDRRYPSAKAFAEDLQRFLDGDPIQARRASLGYRLAKRIRKNRALAAVIAVSSLAVATAAGFGLVMAWRGRVISQSVADYSREAEYMEGLLAKAYTLPLHDVRTERAVVQQRLDAIQARLPRLGRWSRPAAHLALGRGYLALDRLEEARRELELASGGVPQAPDTALALGLTLTRLYQAELDGLRGKTLEDKKQELEKDLRQPAKACLRQAQGAHQDGPAFIEALLALVEERYPDCIARARDYQRSAPWAYEAWLLEADAHRALAARRFGEGDFPATEHRLDLAGQALAQARDVARSAPAAYLGEVQRRLLAYQLNLDRGRATEADRDAALEAADLALKANPDDWKALGYRAAIHRRWAVLELNRGQDPTASLDAAIAAAEAGLRVSPTDNPLWNNLGTCLRNRAEWEVSQGQDPTRTLARAVDALSRALNRPQFKDWLLDSIGNCHLLRAHYQLEHGADPSRAVQDAVDCLSQANAINPWVGHVSSKGAALQDLGVYRRLRGEDPMPAYREAEQAYWAALKLNDHSYQTHQGLAGLLLERAEYTLGAGGGAGPDLVEALRHADAVIRLNPKMEAELLPVRARALALRARVEPAARNRLLDEARSALAQARTAAGTRRDTALPQAEAWLRLALAEPRGGAAPKGLAALAPALRAQAWSGPVAFAEARLLEAAGRKEEAVRAYRRAVALNGNLARVARMDR